MIRQEIENRLYNFLTEKMHNKIVTEIKDIKRFNDIFPTTDKGVAIDCADGIQVILTIQTR